MKIIKVKEWTETPENYTGIAEWPDGSKLWYKNRNLHREDGPAVEYIGGYKEWWLEGQEYGLLNIKDYVVLDHYQGKCDLMWYKLLGKNKVFDYPDIPGLIEK